MYKQGKSITEDVARVLLSLASDDSRFCNGGICMVVDGPF
jgi:hypothetical protein